jgi:hypothetical protein
MNAALNRMTLRRARQGSDDVDFHMLRDGIESERHPQISLGSGRTAPVADASNQLAEQVLRASEMVAQAVSGHSAIAPPAHAPSSELGSVSPDRPALGVAARPAGAKLAVRDNMPVDEAFARPLRQGAPWLVITLAVVLSAVVALIIAAIPFRPSPARPTGMTDAPDRPPPDGAAKRDAIGTPRPAPHFLIPHGKVSGIDDELRLGAAVADPTRESAVQITGLAAGSALSKGQLAGPAEWSVPAAELRQVAVRRPKGFLGTMELVLELKVPNHGVTERRLVALEWRSPASNPLSQGPMKAAPPNGATAAAPPTTLAFVPRKLDPEEVATLMSRGERLFASGDIASARLLFQRAAEANDPGAALALATTYDPAFLRGLGISSATADLALARAWYEKAKMLGSLEASERLDILASHP